LKVKDILTGVAAAGALLLLAAPAQAKTYDWDITDGPYVGHGVITTDPTNSIVTFGDGTVTGPGLTGADGTLSLIADPTGATLISSDGRWQYDDHFGIDFNGLLFQGGGPDTPFFNLYASGATGFLGVSENGSFLQNGSNDLPATSFSVTLVPEPVTWALMLLGVFGVGTALRASQRKQLGATAA
jgi:hypothetical protein